MTLSLIASGEASGSLLDTNLSIHLIQQRPPEVLERFRTLRYGDVLLSAATLAELRHGVERDPREKEAAERALALPIGALDPSAAPSIDAASA